MAINHVDLSQYRCPLALLYFKQALRQFESQGLVEFEFSDRASCDDARRYCESLSLTVLSSNSDNKLVIESLERS